MSKAFTKEDGGAEPMLVAPRAPLPAGVPNYVTARGLSLLRSERRALEEGRARCLANARGGEAGPELAQWSARLAELDQRLGSAVLMAAPDPRDGVRFGSVVTVADDAGRERRYEIVGVDEAEPGSGRIAFLSPLARALLGARPGDSVAFELPGGVSELTVERIE